MKIALILLGCIVGIQGSSLCVTYAAGKYISGQFWLPAYNCHLYVLCVPVDAAGTDYKEHRLSCGELYWSQEVKTCVREVPASSTCNRRLTALPIVSTTATPTSECNFVVNPENSRQFRPKDTEDHKYTTYQSCEKNYHFDLEKCACLPNGSGGQTCDQQSFLYLKLDSATFADTSCTKAVTVKHGRVTVKESMASTVAFFDGSGYLSVPATKVLFAGHYMSQFSVSMFVYIDQHNDKMALILNNAPFHRNTSVLVGYMPEDKSFSAQVRVSNRDGDKQLLDVSVSMDNTASGWQHVAYVYNRGELSLIVNGKHRHNDIIDDSLTPYLYTIDNSDGALTLGGRPNGDFLFKGMISEVRVYKRSLSQKEIERLSKQKL